MIGRIAGLLIEKSAPDVLVDVSGVGYDIQVPMTTYYALPDINKNVILHTHHAVSETSSQLFGFYTKDDRALFRVLIKVSGVGPKMAVGIMSIDSHELAAYILDSNVTALTKVPGVGKKTAERLVIELRDKVKDFASSAANVERRSHETMSVSMQQDWVADAESALIALGYKPADAAKAIAKVNNRDITQSEELIRLALKSMLPG